MEETTASSLIPKDLQGRVKLAANLVVGTSVSTVFKTILRQNFTPKNNLQSVELFVAAYALGGMLAKHSTDYTDDRIDTIFAIIRKERDADVSPPDTTEVPQE